MQQIEASFIPSASTLSGFSFNFASGGKAHAAVSQMAVVGWSARNRQQLLSEEADPDARWYVVRRADRISSYHLCPCLNRKRQCYSARSVGGRIIQSGRAKGERNGGLIAWTGTCVLSISNGVYRSIARTTVAQVSSVLRIILRTTASASILLIKTSPQATRSHRTTTQSKMSCLRHRYANVQAEICQISVFCPGNWLL